MTSPVLQWWVAVVGGQSEMIVVETRFSMLCLELTASYMHTYIFYLSNPEQT